MILTSNCCESVEWPDDKEGQVLALSDTKCKFRFEDKTHLWVGSEMYSLYHEQLEIIQGIMLGEEVGVFSNVFPNKVFSPIENFFCFYRSSIWCAQDVVYLACEGILETNQRELDSMSIWNCEVRVKA